MEGDSGQRKVKRETKKETPAKQEKEKRKVISRDMSRMEVFEESKLSPETKKLFPTVSAFS
jgi:hypothetical protein